ncbi:flagellar protein FlgN [Bacillus sp. V3-13]|uniref:flagellar protein FlgN n=1 Tax=Bacillus sp. V3-13 TaxID=2053728 RepID=UPI000C7572E6|nr:flagellar protein FlgN [Bacillus sp. V3-13]PLR78247.1 flagellar protein FlgN [Bacillus sp. V3-13]
MSAEALITAMDKLLKLHKSLFELAVKKTTAVKQGDMDTLNAILKEEQGHVAAIDRLEKERQKAASLVVADKEQPTVTDCIERLTGTKKELLLEKTNELAEVVLNLKEQNYLNQQLIYYSLQFVNLSINLLRPQPDSINYSPATGLANKKINSQGIFNSKV